MSIFLELSECSALLGGMPEARLTVAPRKPDPGNGSGRVVLKEHGVTPGARSDTMPPKSELRPVSDRAGHGQRPARAGYSDRLYDTFTG